MKRAVLLLLLAGCDLPELGAHDQQQTLTTVVTDAGVAVLYSGGLPCCAVDGETVLCAADGVTCRDCRPGTGDTLCCGQGCAP